MKKIMITVLVGLCVALFSMPVLADPKKEGKQWGTEKTNQMEINRNTNAGVGNGGEYPGGSPSEHGEECVVDHDPGKSMGHNKAAKNDKTPDDCTSP